MITVNEILTGDYPVLTSDMFRGEHSITPEKTLAIDIETTGLSPKDHFVYLIGCAFQEDGAWHLRQWLAESEKEEREVLAAFWGFAGGFDALLHYNGNRFDIPFLKERFSRCDLGDIFERMVSLDLYQYARPLKSILGIDDLKQVSVERFLGVERRDTFSGKELIDVYRQFAEEADDIRRGQLLLHNADDIRGLLKCLAVLSYAAFSENTEQIRVVKAQAKTYDDMNGARSKELYLELALPFTIPAPLSVHRDGCYLKAVADKATLRVPIVTGEMKYFYAAWRDYYYLPEEDTALHKSVAEYVDKAYREKATPATCYTRNYSQYLREWDTVFEPFFRESYEDHALYFELTDERKKSREDLSRYAGHVISHIVQ